MKRWSVAHLSWMPALIFVVGAGLVTPAWAGGIAVVNFQRAVNETEEGKQAQAQLDALFAAKKTQIDEMREELKAKIKAYEAKASILSEEAKKAEQAGLDGEKAEFQRIYVKNQQEMEERYYELLQGIDGKLRALTAKIARDKGYDLVVDNQMVVYSGGATIDMTDELIRRYNAQ